jgi:uncharacterized protein (DUF58 family)
MLFEVYVLLVTCGIVLAVLALMLAYTARNALWKAVLILLVGGCVSAAMLLLSLPEHSIERHREDRANERKALSLASMAVRAEQVLYARYGHYSGAYPRCA